MGKKKVEFWKGRQKENKKKITEQEDKKDFKDRPSGGNRIEKTLKLQENTFLGLYKTKTQKHRETKRKPSKNKNKKLFKFHSFMSAKLCSAENTIKMVLSAEHSF